MSGIEVVGLVLGVVPVIISCLDYYQEGANLYRQYKSSRREFKRIQTDLKLENSEFVKACTKVLRQSFQDNEIKTLLSDLDSELWKRPDNFSRLRSQLGDTLNIFLAKTEDIHSTIQELGDRLGVYSFQKGTARLFREHYERLRFGLAKRDYQDLLDRLRKSNIDLDRLTSPGDTIQPQASSYPAAYVKSVRDCVKSTYSSLKSHWQCSCKCSHRIVLRLGCVDAKQHSMWQLASESGLSEFCFHVLFTNKQLQQVGSIPPPWKWAEMRISSKDQDLIKTVVKTITALNVVPDSRSSNTPDEPRPKNKPRVMFAGVAECSAPQSIASTSIAPPTSSTDLSLPENEITCLCSVLAKQRPDDPVTTLGYLLDQSAKKRHDLMLFEPNQRVGPDCSLVTLENIFSRPGSVQRSMTRRMRMRLARDLSISVLEFGQTPWSMDGWNKKDVLFIQRSNGPLCDDMFIGEDLEPQHAGDQMVIDPNKTAIHMAVVRNQSLFALGILLIELCFGKSAEDICRDNGVSSIVEADGSPKLPPDPNAIRTLIDVVAQEAGITYGSAVRRCLHCTFDCAEDTLDHDSFRRAVYNGVVMPLEDNYRYMSG